MNIEIQNGWILSAILLLVAYLPLAFSVKGRKRLTNFDWINAKGKRLSFIVLLLFILMLILPFFHKITIAPIQLTIGIMIFILGIIGTIVSYNNYFTTDENKLITKGLYRVSRNPI